MLFGLGRGPPGRARSAGLGRPGPREPGGRGAPGRGPPGPDDVDPPGPPGPGWPGRGALRGVEPMPDATGANGLLPGRGPGRGPRRSPGRGEAGREPPWPEPPWPEPWPGPGRGVAGRGPGTGPRCGGAVAGLSAPAPVGTGGTGPRGTGPAGRGAPGRGPCPWPADGPGAGVAEGLAAGGAAACGLAPADGLGAAAEGCGRAGPGRGAGRLPLPSAPWLAWAGPGWPCGRLPEAFGPWAPNSSLSLRTTGASIVEDAERTNSPISWSLAMTALLSTPNSFASSYTRTFATALPLSARLRRAIVADPGQRVLRMASASGSHRRVLIARSSQL